MPEALRTIQLLVAPVVMISACGLLCLALYNRLAAIVSRTRAFHKERFEAAAKLASAQEGAVEDVMIQPLHQRIETLDEQVRQILLRAVLVRNSLLCLLSAILCMLGCSISLGLSLVWGWFSRLALMLFSIGVVVMIAAMTLAIIELLRALDPVFLEHHTMDDLIGG